MEPRVPLGAPFNRGRLWWVRLRGRARVLDRGDEAERGLRLLAEKYEQYRRERHGFRVLAIDILACRGCDALAMASVPLPELRRRRPASHRTGDQARLLGPPFA
jgi:hypothetical protein